MDSELDLDYLIDRLGWHVAGEVEDVLVCWLESFLRLAAETTQEDLLQRCAAAAGAFQSLHSRRHLLDGWYSHLPSDALEARAAAQTQERAGRGARVQRYHVHVRPGVRNVQMQTDNRTFNAWASAKKSSPTLPVAMEARFRAFSCTRG
jgi:hypothetical protein